MKNKNIVIICPQLYPCITGGLEIFYYYLIPEMAKMYNIMVFTNCTHSFKNHNVTLINLNKNILRNKTLSTYCNLFIKTLKNRKDIDLILIPYTSNSPLAYPMLLLYKLFKIPYMISIHGGGMHPWKHKTLQKSFFKNATRITAVSESIKKEYEKRSNKKIRVILPLIPFNTSDLSELDLKKKYGFKNTDKVILAVGSIKKIKGSDILLDAFFRLGLDYVNENHLYLLYAGDGDMRNSLEETVKNSVFKDHVKFIGKIPHEKISEVYKLSNFYVISSFFEGTPKSLLEAMFNGLPIIGSDVKGINNILSSGENGILFKNRNSDDLTKKINKIVENIDFSLKLGKKAKIDYQNKYDFYNIIEEYKILLNQILEDRNES